MQLITVFVYTNEEDTFLLVFNLYIYNKKIQIKQYKSSLLRHLDFLVNIELVQNKSVLLKSLGILKLKTSEIMLNDLLGTDA